MYDQLSRHCKTEQLGNLDDSKVTEARKDPYNISKKQTKHFSLVKLISSMCGGST